MNSYKSIEKEVTIDASLEDVWRAWTTEGGVVTFFAPKANLEFKIGGMYEILFDLNEPIGKQGSEGAKILSYLPYKMLSFNWNAPPEFGLLRDERTIVVLLFDKVGDVETNVHLSHIGWGDGDEWDKLYEYFLRAWNVVLGRLKYRFNTAHIDWSNPFSPE